MKIYFSEIQNGKWAYFSIEHDKRHLFWREHPNAKEASDHIRPTFPPGRDSYELVQFKAMFDRLENIGVEKAKALNEQTT